MVTQNGVLVSRPLTEGAISQIEDKSNYSIARALPIITTNSIVGTYKYWDKNDLARYENQLRQPGSSYKRVDLDVAQKTYHCLGYGLKTGIAVENELELGGNPLQTGADYLMDQGLQTLETSGFAKLLTTGKYANDVTPTVKWDVATATIISDVRTWKIAGRKAGRRELNVGIIAEDVFEACLQNQDILDRMPTNEMRILTQEEQLARVFGLEALYVSKASNITVNEGHATLDEPTSIATDKFLLFHRSKGNYRNNANGALIIIRDNGLGIPGSMGMGVTNPYFDEDTDERIIKLKQQFDIIIPATACGVLAHTILT